MVKRTVEESSLISVADSIRAKTGQSGKLEFPSGYKSAIDSISKSEIKNQDITIKENGTYTPDDGYTGFGTVKVEVEGSGGGDIPDASTAEFGRVKVSEYAPGGKACYNGVLLPEIPADVLAEYPYVLIAKSEHKTRIYASEKTIYKHIDDGNNKIYIRANRIRITLNIDTNKWGEPEMATSDTNLMLDSGTSSAQWFLIWSNHDIPNGSATATDIYFKGSEPVKEVNGYGDYVDGADKYAVAIEALNEIAHRIQLHHSSYDLVSGAEMFGFLNRSNFYEKGYANSTLELGFKSSASGSLS